MPSPTDSLPKTYQPHLVEDKWYAEWIKRGYFTSIPNSKTAYTVVIPPPNITGVLHMGHMLNNTIQDVLIRRARMQGYNACWVPGTDHASIATETKVVQMLEEQGIAKSSLTREAFLTHAWNWKEKYGGIILEQLKKIGASCDWNRTRFTMEPDLSDSVTQAFIDLYQKGLLYRGLRMVNWDPQGKTALSDEEVIFKETQGLLYYVQYPFCDGSGHLTIATTRPETILADVAVCVNPNDERYTQFVGKQVLVPLTERAIPVIADEYVSKEFGTGCLKITPAHDLNDYQIGQKHGLPIIDILTDTGQINEAAQNPRYVGKDRFAVRKLISKDLQDSGYLLKTESYTHQVGTSERTGAVIEPRLSQQWFVNMNAFMEKHPEVLTSVLNDEIRFYPAKMKNTYKHWIENIKDWCISRQLWWGHRIPAWYDSKGRLVVAKNEAEAQLQFYKQYQEQPDQLSQDQDVLDTWFSSWLWPMSVFNGFKPQGQQEIQYYYPTQDLVTGPDIIFFWVARMIMAGYEWTGQKPFKNVYFTGIVRDSLRRKMSKSLGNSPDPLELIETYGADAVRMGVLLSAPAGNDILFDISQVEQGRNFCNKIWNAYKLIRSFQTDAHKKPDAAAQEAMLWFKNRMQQQFAEVHALLESYRISEALMVLYKLIWDDFCSWYLEGIKPAFTNGLPERLSETVVNETQCLFELLLTELHPWMPFITEALWQELKPRSPEEALTVSQWPELFSFDSACIQTFERSRDFILQIRQLRAQHQVSPKLALKAEFDGTLEINRPLIIKLSNLSALDEIKMPNPEALLFNIETMSCAVYLSPVHTPLEERARIQKELDHLQDFLMRTESKLKNQNFMARAKPEVIDLEQKKADDARQKIMNLEKQLLHLSKP